MAQVTRYPWGDTPTCIIRTVCKNSIAITVITNNTVPEHDQEYHWCFQSPKNNLQKWRKTQFNNFMPIFRRILLRCVRLRLSVTFTDNRKARNHGRRDFRLPSAVIFTKYNLCLYSGCSGLSHASVEPDPGWSRKTVEIAFEVVCGWSIADAVYTS